jgi:hypothetical protein
VADDQAPIPVIPPAELARWDATIATAEAADKAAGITDPGTVSARAAYGIFAARRSGGSRG